MKLTRFIVISFVTCSGVLALSPIAQAEDGASVTSEGIIGFIENTDIVDPTDPIEPGNPLVPIYPGPGGTAGPLSIDYVSKIQFGVDNKTSGKDEVYWAKLDKFKGVEEGEVIERPNFIQVTDKRGSNVGWRLTVTQNEQFKNGTEELTGAVLTLGNGALKTSDGGTTPTIYKPIILDPGTPSDVAIADVNQGTGTWIALFGSTNEEAKESISLEVPGSTKKVQGEYKTELTWDLTDAPA